MTQIEKKTISLNIILARNTLLETKRLSMGRYVHDIGCARETLKNLLDRVLEIKSLKSSGYKRICQAKEKLESLYFRANMSCGTSKEYWREKALQRKKECLSEKDLL